MPTTAAGPNAALLEASPKQGEGVDPNHPCSAHMVVVDADQGIVAPPPGAAKRKNIAICGFASSTRHYILDVAKKPDWEIFGLNQLYRHIPRADRWFDIHCNWDKETVPGTDHRKWAQECGIPFYMMRHEPSLPTSVTYPLDKVMKHFGGVDYFTSTIPYMMALALMEIDVDVRERLNVEINDWCAASARVFATTGEIVTEQPDWWLRQQRFYAEYMIGVFGIDLVVGGEYFQEKPCAEFWIGAAALGRGVQLAIPPESALCKQLHRYGYDPEPNQFVTSTEINAHTAQLTAERDEQIKKLYMLEGAMSANNRWQQVVELRSRGAKVDI